MRQETQYAEAEIVGDEYDTFGRDLLAVVDDAAEAARPFTRQRMIAAAGQPHHHRQQAIRLFLRPPNIDVEAVLIALYLACDELRAHGAVATAIAHAIPVCRRKRCLP